ncbi:gp53-like domain-containing protein [Arsenophonus sp. PmNCSU2021_1]|uniref:gp53-like domain-containing protein n=1 Tax=Arsenophonus sp. PmNCSU2021_1 TaxID=3118989 RepID=UPI003FA5A468
MISQKACDEFYAKKNSEETLKVGRLNVESPTGDTIFNLGGTNGSSGSEFAYVRNSKRTQVHDTGSKTTVIFPQKNGTLAIQEDNYTKTEVDAKINSAKWTVKKSANGWLKDPNTGLIIQWGYRSKERKEGNSYTINFPTAFSSSVYSITTSSKAHNTSADTMFVGIAYDVTTRGFNYYVRGVGGSNDTFMDGYYWMAIGV